MRILILLLLLSGCSQIGQLAATDATGAAAMAAAFTSYDPQAAGRVPCYNAFGQVGNSVSTQGFGLFQAVEGGIEIQAAMQVPACQAIAGQVLLWTLRKAPIGGGLLP